LAERLRASRLLAGNNGAWRSPVARLLWERVPGGHNSPAIRSSLGRFARGAKILRGFRTPCAFPLAHELAHCPSAHLALASEQCLSNRHYDQRLTFQEARCGAIGSCGRSSFLEAAV
jgi:hypothetical protein